MHFCEQKALICAYNWNGRENSLGKKWTAFTLKGSKGIPKWKNASKFSRQIVPAAFWWFRDLKIAWDDILVNNSMQKIHVDNKTDLTQH